MLEIDVDEIQEVNYLDNNRVQITFKNSDIRVYDGPDFAEALEILKHWTPPTA